MKRLPWRECLAALSLAGCVLAWQPTDTPSAKAEKLAARIPLGAVTLGMSEVIIARETARDAEWKAEAARNKRRAELVEQAKHWQDMAVKTKDSADRELYLVFYRAVRDDIAALDGSQPPAQDTATALPEPMAAQQ
jgi:hypothetical protein